jgi:iron(III) transport system permease protein
MNYNLAGIRKPGWSLANYERASRKLMMRSINNTLIISVAALALIIVIAVLISYLTVRRSSPFHHALDTITMLPYILPGAVIGIALLGAFNYPVFNNGSFRISGTIGIIVIAMAIRRMPFTSRSATAAIMQIPISTEEAAISLGASDLKTFVKITIPMMSSGILSGAVLSWVSIITEMSASLMLYNNRSITLTVNTYTQIVGGNDGVAAAFATVTTAFTVVCLILYLIITRNQKDGIGL